MVAGARTPPAAGETHGISFSAGGGIGVATQPRQRRDHIRGRLKVLGGVLHHHPIDDGDYLVGDVRPQRADVARWRFWCQISFCATDPSGNGGLPVRRK